MANQVMKLTVLGSGTCIPSLKRNAPGYLVETNSLNILLDCGTGTLLQLEKLDKSYREIDLVLVSHTHPDHVADLVPLLQALLVTPPEMRKKGITLVGSLGFSDFLKQAVLLHMSWPEKLSLNIVETNGSFEFREVSITSTKVLHSENSVSYRLEANGQSLVYSGDCDYDENLVALARKADLLVLECSFSDSMKFEGHLTSSECGTIASKAEARRLLLTHFYPVSEDVEARRNECGLIFKGEILLAEDLMAIGIN